MASGWIKYRGERFCRYRSQGDSDFYRCIKHSIKCQAEIKLNSKTKTASMLLQHNHKVEARILIPPPQMPDSLKDVTSEVEMISNRKNATVLFHNGHKFIKYVHRNSCTSYRCVKYLRSLAECPVRIKHNTETGEFFMYGCHSHPLDHGVYEAFLETATRVRKFAKKSKPKEPEEELDPSLDMGHFALEMTRKKFEMLQKAREDKEAVESDEEEEKEGELEDQGEESMLVDESGEEEE